MKNVAASGAHSRLRTGLAVRRACGARVCSRTSAGLETSVLRALSAPRWPADEPKESSVSLGMRAKRAKALGFLRDPEGCRPVGIVPWAPSWGFGAFLPLGQWAAPSLFSGHQSYFCSPGLGASHRTRAAGGSSETELPGTPFLPSVCIVLEPEQLNLAPPQETRRTRGHLK